MIAKRKRINVYLDENQIEKLKAISNLTGLNMAYIIRAGVFVILEEFDKKGTDKWIRMLRKATPMFEYSEEDLKKMREAAPKTYPIPNRSTKKK